MAGATEPFLSALLQAATEAQSEEVAFRNNIAREIEKRERARQYAFRRLSVADLMARAAGTAKDEERAVAAQVAALRAEFGWLGDSERHRRIFDAWRPVALTVWENVKPQQAQADAATVAAPPGAPASPPDVVAALAAFEAWYLAEFGSNYLSILDQEVLELPVVEF